jgi:hypothetical protein
MTSTVASTALIAVWSSIACWLPMPEAHFLHGLWRSRHEFVTQVREDREVDDPGGATGRWLPVDKWSPMRGVMTSFRRSPPPKPCRSGTCKVRQPGLAHPVAWYVTSRVHHRTSASGPKGPSALTRAGRAVSSAGPKTSNPGRTWAPGLAGDETPGQSRSAHRVPVLPDTQGA